MIIDLDKFIVKERPYWKKLESLLSRLEADPRRIKSLEDIKEFHYLYERSAAGLARLTTFSAERELRTYLEQVVARAYAEIHESRRRSHKLSILTYLLQTIPQAFRRQRGCFWLSLSVFLGGALFGALLLTLDPSVKATLLPFEHLLGDPADRVAKEESLEQFNAFQSAFAAQLMENNIRVSILAMAMGMTFGIGTLILLFFNGIILGAVALDYIAAGQTAFLAGWLLPHGAVEIPAILIGGQAGFVLARGLIGWGNQDSLRVRMRKISADMLALMVCVVVMLIWAGIVESFFSQYHAPVLPYSIKITFGVVELAALIFYLGKMGRKGETPKPESRELSE